MRRALSLVFVAACASDVTVDDMPFFDAGPFDATTTNDAALPGDAGPLDAGVDATKFNGGGPFFCIDCVCDGTLNMCVNGGGGGMPIAQDASFGDASACDFDAGQTYCQQIPVSCLPKPTCACIESFMIGCTCSVDPSGDGFVLQCTPKP